MEERTKERIQNNDNGQIIVAFIGLTLVLTVVVLLLILNVTTAITKRQEANSMAQQIAKEVASSLNGNTINTNSGPGYYATYNQQLQNAFTTGEYVYLDQVAAEIPGAQNTTLTEYTEPVISGNVGYNQQVICVQLTFNAQAYGAGMFGVKFVSPTYQINTTACAAPITGNATGGG